MHFKNVIFDFGNVLFDLDLPQIFKRFEQLMGHRYESVMHTLRANRVFERYETGDLDTEHFLAQIVSHMDVGLSPEQVKEAWNAIFLQMPAHRFELLLALRQRYKVFLLSNINDLHLNWIEAYMTREHGIYDFETRYFDKVYYSHLIRLRKPERDIYEYVLRDANLNAQESIFFDDLPENVAAAAATGITGVWHEPGTEITAHCRKLGLM